MLWIGQRKIGTYFRVFRSGTFDASIRADAIEGRCVLQPMLRLYGLRLTVLSVSFATIATPASATERLDGAALQLWLGIPFVGLLLSIALGPVFVKKFWHIHYDKAAAFWALTALVLLVATQGFAPTVSAFVANMVDNYLPFILMLFALYVAAGGVVVRGPPPATPLGNSLLLAAGTLAASFIGTTGASMIFIRPLLQANAGRAQRTHVVIFFIFLVSNIGGALSPLGDPPLFFGFLRGVDFFWPLRNLWPETLLMVMTVLAVFFAGDWILFRSEQNGPGQPTKASIPRKRPEQKFEVVGIANIGLIILAVGAIITSAVWHPGIGFDFVGARIELQALVRDVAMLVIGLVSLAVTSNELRRENGFRWEPFEEVAKIFAAIFTCMIPVMAMLAANAHGSFAPIIGLLSHADGRLNSSAYFWATGLLASLLDNAPTYLVFFGLAGGDAAALMGPSAKTLAAISLGSVYMGALTYIGNAPNFMVYAMARRARVPMPGFFGYMIWSGGVLLPLFAIVTVWFF
jgi:Na+/H+ antiporter NhaD/arsenite permease-like protein